MNFEIHPSEVKKLLESGEAVKLIDVREVKEHQICSIEGAELVPMGTIPEQVSRLEEEADEKLLVVFCHHGARSMNVVSWLRGNGIENCVSMAGGIDAWSALVDPAVPRY